MGVGGLGGCVRCVSAPFSFEALQGVLGVSPDDGLEIQLGAEMRQLLEGTRAEDTWTTYRPAWRRFVDLCEKRSPPRRSLPAAPSTVCLYLMWLGQSANTYSVIRKASGAISTFHEVGLVEEAPTKHHTVSLIRTALQRKIGVTLVNQKEPLPWETVRGTALWVREGRCTVVPLTLAQYGACLMVVAFCAFFRYKDVKRLMADEVHFFEDRAELFLETRKNDQLREGNVVFLIRGQTEACPVRMLEWLASHHPGGHVPLFQGYDGWKIRKDSSRLFRELSGEGLPFHQYQRLVFRPLAAFMGRDEVDLMKEFGTQSLRSGGATLIAATDVDSRVFQRHGGWRTVGMKDHYVKDTLEAKLAVTRAMDY